MGEYILAIDPGCYKCGVAIGSKEGGVIKKHIVLTENFEEEIKKITRDYDFIKIIIGNKTYSENIKERLEKEFSYIGVELVDEHFTSLRARDKFFRENPPKGIKRLLPVSLQTPNRPYDDYAAQILLEDYLRL